MDRVAVAQLILPRTSTEASFWSTFSAGCGELEGADSFLCEEFGRKFWRQRVAFD